MSTSYPAPLIRVNDFSLRSPGECRPVTEISPSALSFYRWLCRWHAQTGEVYASTGYLARKQRRTERTVYRWLAELRDAGCIASEVVQGVQRSIVPLIPAPAAPRSSRPCSPRTTTAHKSHLWESERHREQQEGEKMSGVVSGVMSGVVSGVLPKNDTRTQDASTQAAPVVAALAEEGVTPAVAVQLLAQVGAEEARKQLEALPFRRAKDRAAVLVASIRERWDVPRAYVDALESKRKEAQEAQKRALAASLAQKRAEQRSQAETALSGLSAGEYADLEARALIALAHNVAWRIAQARPGGVAADKLLRAKMLELLEASNA